MRKKTEIATNIIADLDTVTIEYVRGKLSRKIRRGAEPEFYYNEAPVYHFGDNGTGFYALTVDGEVCYFVRYKLIRHNKLHLGRQILLWRDKTSIESAGFAKHLFFNVLLPKYGSVVADQEQTENGRDFWTYAINDAMKSDKYYIYVLDRRSNENQLILMDSLAKYRIWAKRVWGEGEAFKRIFMVVSLKPLSIESK